jgi:hypothetical protein
MIAKKRALKLALAALLFSTLIQSSLAAPPQTGIRGQTRIYQPGFLVEVSPGVWVGGGGFSFGWPASFAVLSAHSGREITHVSTGTDGSFEVSLPPGKYVVVPDALPWYPPMVSSFEVAVTVKHYTDVFIYYEAQVIYFTPESP